mgnify:CR=1 FL=1
MKTGSYTEPCKCHTCVRTASYMCASYSSAHFLTCGETSFLLARFFLLTRPFFAGATFFCWRDFFSLARLYFCWRDFFFAGATFFYWHDFFSLARLFSQALICRTLLVLLWAQTTSTYSCKQDG